jgi:hypothetical protein
MTASAARRKEPSVLLVAYAVLAGVVAWALGRRGGPWILRLREPARRRARLAAGLLDAVAAALGLAVLGLQLADDGQPHVLGWTITTALLLGSIAYAAGLLTWRGPQAVALRVVGYLLIVLALAIPSTLTLALPLVAPLAVTLAPIPDHAPAEERSAS